MNISSIAPKIISAMIIGASTIGGTSAIASRTETTTERIVETIQHQTITEYDDSMREGAQVVKQEGINGSKTINYLVTRNHSGEEIAREAVDIEIAQEAQDEIITIGTKKYYTCSNGTEYDSEIAKDECERRVNWNTPHRHIDAATEEPNNDCQGSGSCGSCPYNHSTTGHHRAYRHHGDTHQQRW